MMVVPHLMLFLLPLSSAIVQETTLKHSAAIVHAGEDGEDFETIPPQKREQSQPRQFTGFQTYQGDQNLCPEKTFCTVMSDCRLLMDLMERSCLLPARLKELTCGYQKNELMLCCPSGGTSSPFRPGSSGFDDQFSHDPSDHGSDHGLNQKCGRPQLNGWQGGYNGLGSQPWLVRIGFKNSDNGATEYPCCGSLITPTVVLTAAHCALAKSTGRNIASVRVGEYDMRTDPDCTNTFCGHVVQNIPVKSVIVHPGYERKIFRHDIALIVLKSPANLSLSTQPICLLQSPTIPLVGRRALLTGFGKLPDEETASPVQQQLQLPIVSLENCNKIYEKVIPITSNHLCVGGEPKKDACSGFGGAPLVIVDPYRQDHYIQVGIVSFGSDKCGASGIPSVYTSIIEYFPWIKANLP